MEARGRLLILLQMEDAEAILVDAARNKSEPLGQKACKDVKVFLAGTNNSGTLGTGAIWHQAKFLSEFSKFLCCGKQQNKEKARCEYVGYVPQVTYLIKKIRHSFT